MVEEEVVAPVAAAAPSDLKRKLDDLEHESLEHAEGRPSPKSNADDDASENGDDGAAEADGSEAKRPRHDDDDQKLDGLANANGLKEQNSDEVVEAGQPTEDAIEDEQETLEVKIEQHSAVDEHVSVDNQQISVKEETKEVLINTDETSIAVKEETKEITIKDEEAVEHSNEEHPQEEVDYSKSEQPSSTDASTTSRKIEVPNNKVGVLIGKAGDTIRYLQYNSGAKIQITRDADADPNSATRPVEIIGTLSNIDKAEKLINAVIAEADAGGSPSLVARGLATAQAAGIGEQVEIKVPNEKVGLIIGRGGETIKGLQTRSGARIQLIPQHLPEGDGSKDRIVRVTGDMRQIEMAQEMIKEVLNQTVRPSPLSSGFNQQGYRPRGPSGPPQWGPRSSHPPQPMVYDYPQRGPYPSQNQYPHPTYGNYPPQQIAPRGNYGGPPSMQGPPQSGAGGYDYYGGHGGHVSDRSHSTSMPGHAPVPSQAPAGGPPPLQANYNYGQPHGPEYGHQPPYAQSAPQQGYGHGYEDSHAAMQHHYGGHGSSQPVYSQGGMQPSYPPQQQYGKPPYGMPTQGTQPQSYGAPRPGQPGDMPYQSQVPSAQAYGPNVPHQQPYPYATSGAMQQTYPSYGSAPATDGYNQPPASTPGYSQQVGQAVPSYTQPAGQQASGYGQVAPTGYAQYTSSQQVYPDQQAPNSASYGYQGTQDPSYGSSAAGSAYAAQPSGQTGYVQPTATAAAAAAAAGAQPSYDQSASQSSAYGVAQGNATVSYGKTVSPQPSYPQYDSTQMYAAPR